jgi:nucleotide-binding universal stress UspA family protein
MIKNILVSLDGSEHSETALSYGLWLAEKFDATLLGQHVIDTVSLESFFHDISGSLGFEPYLDFSTRMRDVLETRGEAVLEAFRGRCQEKGIRFESFLDMGIIPNEICERAKVADLVMIGHKGVNEKFSTGLLGRTAESVTRKSPRPVFVSPQDFREITNPMLAYDGSQRASTAMEHAAEVCAFLNLPLTVLHAVKEPKVAEKVIQEARGYLSSYKLKAEYLAIPGYPEKVIISTLQKNSHDLLFIGAYGHRRIIEMVLGSTTEYVLRNCSCPVFLSR